MPAYLEKGGNVLRVALPAILALGSLSIAADKPNTSKKSIEYADTADRISPQQLGALSVRTILRLPGETVTGSDPKKRNTQSLLPDVATLSPPPPLVFPSPNTASNGAGLTINLDTPMWRCIRQAESNDQYNNPDKPSGAYGILLGTWDSWLPQHGFNLTSGYQTPAAAPPKIQDEAAQFLYNYGGFTSWNDPCTGRG